MARRTTVISVLAVLALGAWWWLAREWPPAPTKESQSAQLGKVSSARSSYRVPGKWPEVQATSKPTSVKGRIRTQDGAPLIDGMVCAFCADCDTMLNGHEPVCVRPDMNGDYEFTDLSAGKYHISASAKGYRPRLTNRGKALSLNGTSPPNQDADLDKGGAELSGIVLDATGGPVAGAQVQANFLSEELAYGRWYTAATESDANGAFSLMAESGLVMLLARAEGYAPARFQSAAPSRGVRLALTPTSRISGMVVTRDERLPVANVQVTARSMLVQQIATSDGTGAFSIEGLQPGIYTLNAAGDGWIGQYPGSVTVDISETAQDLVLPVGRAARVLGTIRVGDEPCQSGEAHLAPTPGQSLPSLVVRSGLAGEVVFEGVPAGTYQSSAMCDRYGPAEGPVIEVQYSDVTDVRWTIPKGIDVTLHLQTQDGQAAPQTWVQLQQDGGNPLETASQERSGADGTVRFFGVEEGSYLVTTQVMEDPPRIEVRAANAPNEFTVRVSAPGAIEVTVLDADGESNDAVAVSAIPRDRGPRGGVGEHIASGTYSIGPLPTGDYWVQIRDGVNPMIEVGEDQELVHVQADRVSKLTVRYGGGNGTISGRVIDSDGVPLANIWVGAVATTDVADPFGMMLDFQTQSQARRSLTNVDGSFSIGELNEGATFTVSASYSLGGSVSIKGARVGQAIELTLPPLCGLAGIVRDAHGQPAEYFRITVSNSSGSQRLSPEFGPENHGSWSVDRVASGHVEIVAIGPTGAARIERTLGPGQQLSDLVLTLAPQAGALP